MKRRHIAAAAIGSVLILFCSCNSERLTQFSTFAAAGSLYVDNLHQVIAQAGTAMIASDSAVLIAAGKIAGKDLVSSHRDQYAKDIQTDDAELQQYLATLQVIDAHATLLGSYFSAIAQLANNGAATKGTTAAGDLLDSIAAFNSKVESATLKAGNFNTTVKQFVQTNTPLVIAHFEVRALDEQLKKDAPTVDQALALQEAAVTAIASHMKEALATTLQVRESSDVIGPYVANIDNLPSNWNSNREAFLRAKVTIESVDNAKAAITQLRKDFRKLVQSKDASIDFTTLLSDINKMTGYVGALESTTQLK
jgi:hypothetical protein